MEVAWIVCVFLVCTTSLAAWILWLRVQPPCTMEEFRKVVDQCNRLTVAFTEVKETADSVRSAVGMSRVGR